MSETSSVPSHLNPDGLVWTKPNEKVPTEYITSKYSNIKNLTCTTLKEIDKKYFIKCVDYVLHLKQKYWTSYPVIYGNQCYGAIRFQPKSLNSRQYFIFTMHNDPTGEFIQHFSGLYLSNGPKAVPSQITDEKNVYEPCQKLRQERFLKPIASTK